MIGLACGMIIGKITEYFTSFDFAPVKSIKARGATGPATVTIQGLGVGMISCVPTIVVLVCAILGCAAIKGEYGVAIAAVGMLATLGITLATDAYGPVADNAGGLAEMDPAIPDEVRCITDSLDALGNTTAATGKGFAIGSAVLTSLSLLAAFKEQAQLDVSLLAVTDPYVLSGMLFGAMLPVPVWKPFASRYPKLGHDRRGIHSSPESEQHLITRERDPELKRNLNFDVPAGPTCSRPSR